MAKQQKKKTAIHDMEELVSLCPASLNILGSPLLSLPAAPPHHQDTPVPQRAIPRLVPTVLLLSLALLPKCPYTRENIDVF